MNINPNCAQKISNVIVQKYPGRNQTVTCVTNINKYIYNISKG